MAVKIIGAKEISKALDSIKDKIKNVELVTEELARLMEDYVHVSTGYLKSTIYYKNNIAGAKAAYAGFEEERSNTHDYATQAIKAFNESKYLDQLVEDF